MLHSGSGVVSRKFGTGDGHMKPRWIASAQAGDATETGSDSCGRRVYRKPPLSSAS